MTAKLSEMKVASVMYTDKRADELLELLAWAAGLTISEYTFEQGTLTIPYAWFNEDESIWYYMKKVAEAEGGRVFFDRQGKLRFWNKNHYINNQTTKYNYSFDSNISDINFEVSSEKIINHVIVKAKPREELSNRIVWALSGYETIAPSSSIEYEIVVDDPCTVLNEPTANDDFLANTESNGSGDDRTSFVTITNFDAKAKKATMTINNTHVSDTIYLTIFQVKGQPAVVKHEIEVDVKDTDSVAKYKNRELTIENDYIQDVDYAEALAKRRIIELRDPLSFIELEVIGNPEIEVGDVCTVQDSYDGTIKLESKILNF